MKKKCVTAIVLLILILTSGFVWADTSLSKFTPAKLPISPDSESLIMKYENSIFISGYKGNDAYLIKCDTKLKAIWELKVSSLPSESEIYGGYIYAVSSTNIMKISMDGTLVWDVKIPVSKGRFSPVDITVVGTQIFTNGFQHISSDTFLGSILCNTDGKSIVSKTFTYKTDSCGQNFYYQGAFFFENGNDHYVSTTDNIKFKDVTSSEFYKYFHSEKRVFDNLFTVLYENGSTKKYDLKDHSETVIAYLPDTFYEVIALDSQTLFGLQIDASYQVFKFSLVKGIHYIETLAKESQPLKISTSTLSKIVSLETLSIEMNKVTNDYFQILGDRISSANSISRLTEYAISKIAAQTVVNGTSIDKTRLSDAWNTYLKASENSDLLMENVFYTRGIKKYITFNLIENDGSLTLTNDLYSEEMDGIIINAPEMSITIPAEALKEISQLGHLKIQFSKKANLPSLTLSQKLKNPIIISIPTSLTNTDLLTLVDENGYNLGGLYNPVTGRLETRVKKGGTFNVKNGSRTFTDIALQDNETQTAIKALTAKGIMGGKTETLFKPDQLITRAEIAGILLTITCLLEDGQPILLSPNALVTKEEIVTILSSKLQKDSNYINLGEFDDYAGFADKNLVSNWAQEHFAFAGYENLLISPTENYLDPKENLTRGDAARLIYNFYKVLQ